MKTNDIFRKLSRSLALDTAQLQAIFALMGIDLTDKEIANLLKTDYEPRFEPMPEYILALFLNGLIEFKRGKKDDAEPAPIDKLAKIGNNEILKKLRIAYNLQEQQVRDALKLVTIELTKSELSALFRKPGHAQFKGCDDELVLDFIEGLGLLLQQPASEV
jgi:uncharacterized protein YehS (DUF1456 family)